MGVVDGFDSMWSNAKSTFGQGTPQEGARFDNSAQLRQMQSDVYSARPDSRWTGSASDSYASANDKQGRVLGQIADLDQRLRTEVDRSAQVVNAGRQNLDSVRQWVHDAAATVPAGQRDRMLYPIVSKGAAEIADILQKSNSDLNTIAGRVRSLSGEYQMLGGDLKQGTGPDGENPDTLTEEERKKREEEVKKRAQADVKAALDGDKGAVQRVQNVLNTVSKEQQAGRAKLNTEQQAYLSQMQAQQKLRSLAQLEETANNGARGIMADSWQLMSNPKVEFPKTESVDGALQSDEMINGGFDQLPDSVQHTINSSGTQNSENLQKVADIVNGGNDHFQTNTDLDRGLMHKVADMMESPEWRNGDQWDNPIDLDMPWEPAPPPTHAELERTASSVMEAVSADHQVVHDAITGDVEPGNEFRDQFKVNSEHLLYNLTHEEWDDNGAAAGSLFDWTKSAATGPEAGIAAATASTYAEYIGAHSNDLMHLNGSNVVGLDGVHTLGAVNPHLTYAMADGLTPYINNIAGLPGGPEGFAPLDDLGQWEDASMPDAKGLFAVLNSEQSTATLWNSEVYKQVLQHETAFAQNPSNFGAEPHLTASATLRGLVDAGTVGAFDAFAQNQNQIAATEHEWKQFGYDAALGTLTAGGGSLPGVGPIAGEAIDKVGGALQDEILGTTTPIDSKDSINNMSPEMASKHILSAMVAVGQDVPLPHAYYEDGQLVGYPQGAQAVIVDGEIVCPPGVYPPDFLAAVTTATNEVLGPVPGGNSAAEGMAGRYTGVTENPDPNG